jgi:hypothetical protein
MRRARVLFRFFVVGQLALWIVAAGCAGGLGAKRGNVHRGVYHSPADNFSVPVPRGHKISEGHHADLGAVSFHNDFGGNLGILYAASPAGTAIATESAAGAVSFSAWLNDFVIPSWFIPVSPTSRVLAESDGTFEGMPALFALIDAAGAHALQVITFVDGRMQSGRLNSRRVAVVFRKGTYTYMLTMETAVLWPGTAPAEPKEDWVERADELKAFYQSISFGG